MRPAIFLKRPQGHPQAIEVLSLSPDQYGLVLGPASVLVLFGGKEIPIEGTYGEAWMETWHSLQECKEGELLPAIHGRLNSLLRSRAETFYNLSVEKHREGQWTYLQADATVSHGPLRPQESNQAMVPVDNCLILPIAGDGAIADITQFLAKSTLLRFSCT